MLHIKAVRNYALKRESKLKKKRIKRLEREIDRKIFNAMQNGEFIATFSERWGFDEVEREVFERYSKIGGFNVEAIRGTLGESYSISWRE